MRALISAIILAFAIPMMTVRADRRDRTTRHHLTPISEESAGPDSLLSNCDTIIGPINQITFCGYEKTVNSTKETIFISNPTDSTIHKVSFTITYLDDGQRILHRRSLSQAVTIPPLETRRIDIPSWDRQKTYYYIKGPRPRKSATPYDISITPDTILIAPCTR